VEAVQSELGKIETGIPTTERAAPKRKPMTSKEVTVTFSPKKVLIPALIIVALLIVGVAIWQLLLPKKAALPTPEKHSIAVLPFEDLSLQKDQEHFCDGLADELINRLNKVESLIVPARSSSFYFKGKDLSPQEIGEKLKVDNILEGTLRKSGNRLRITVSLINVADGYPIWSDQYQRDEEDIFDLQDKISLDIVDNLKIKLLGEEKAEFTKRTIQDPEAYDLYLRGRHFWNSRTARELKKAYDSYSRDDLEIISINIDSRENAKTIQDFRDQFSEIGVELDWIFGMDSEGIVSEKYMNEGAIPTLAIFDSKGRLHFRKAGVVAFEEIPQFFPETTPLLAPIIEELLR